MYVSPEQPNPFNYTSKVILIINFCFCNEYLVIQASGDTNFINVLVS